MGKKTISGAEGFFSYYSGLFGQRWNSLYSALLGSTHPVGFSENLLKPYFLDAGSIEAALALPAVTAGTVLDMCAAPGGKSLILAVHLDADSKLTSNEFSRQRRQRLLNVLDEYLPRDIRARVRVTGHDATRWSRYEKEAYDRILLDVPCSSERHVLASERHLAEWSPSRVKALSQRQWALLSGAWLVLKPGGYIVYSTCALSPKENDDVVGKLLSKYPDAEISAPAHTSPLAEKTSCGFHILPDTGHGAGPLYYSLIKRVSCKT